MSYIFKLLILSLLLPFTVFLNTCYADQTGDSKNFTFRGIFIITSSCTISNDQIIDVLFDNISIHKIDGVQYKKTIPFIVDCNASQDSLPVNVTMSGSTVNFDNTALRTSAEGLGLQIQINGRAHEINKPFTTTLGELISLQLTAVPVKDPSKSLSEQPFTATATLTADYE